MDHVERVRRFTLGIMNGHPQVGSLPLTAGRSINLPFLARVAADIKIVVAAVQFHRVTVLGAIPVTELTT